MTDVTVTSPVAVSIETLRDAYVSQLGGVKLSAKAYAKGLLDTLGTEWLTMAHDAKGAEGDAMRAERDALYDALRKNGHSNPSVKWKQIKDSAREILAEEERAARIAAGESPEDIDAEAAAEAQGKKKDVRSPQLRLVEDLTGLYKMCKREAKTLTEAQRKASLHITAALADLGVDVSQL